MTIHHILELPYELESQTCTCRKRPGWKNEFSFSKYWNRPIHSQCNKPTQDEVIYQCADCEEFFISRTLYPELKSVLYIARAINSPTPSKRILSNIEDVFCDDCS